jgi:Carbohydrate esterase, sialic acid-specific acetylesterase
MSHRIADISPRAFRNCTARQIPAMRSSHLLRFIFAFICLTGLLTAQEATLPPKEEFHLFLLVGQSNMAGRGTVAEQDKTPHPRVLMLSKDGRWMPAVDPMHFDKPSAGVGLGKTFGRVIAEANPGVTIGLIPCAVGGSPIDTWKPGVFYAPTKSHPWDDTVKRVALAMPAGTVKGILWHQGESDCRPELASAYAAKLHDLVMRLRELVKAPEVPSIAGQMGKFDDVPWTPEIVTVDQAHRDLSANVPRTAFVSAEGLKHKGDRIHFDAASCRELGRRYAETFLKMVAP